MLNSSQKSDASSSTTTWWNCSADKPTGGYNNKNNNNIIIDCFLGGCGNESVLTGDCYEFGVRIILVDLLWERCWRKLVASDRCDIRRRLRTWRTVCSRPSWTTTTRCFLHNNNIRAIIRLSITSIHQFKRTGWEWVPSIGGLMSTSSGSSVRFMMSEMEFELKTHLQARQSVFYAALFTWYYRNSFCRKCWYFLQRKRQCKKNACVANLASLYSKASHHLM